MRRSFKKPSTDGLLELFGSGRSLVEHEMASAVRHADLDVLIAAAGILRDRRHGSVISYSPKVFIPLTQLCRDSCHYCTFAHPPRKGETAYLQPEDVLAIAKSGAQAGCKEALFTLGDKPERRYSLARRELEKLGHETTISYLVACAQLVFEETGLFPHLNPVFLFYGQSWLRKSYSYLHQLP